MKDLSSLYITEVYTYNSEKNEYIMEYMDYTLEAYISKHNSSLTMIQRKISRFKFYEHLTISIQKVICIEI